MGKSVDLTHVAACAKIVTSFSWGRIFIHHGMRVVIHHGGGASLRERDSLDRNPCLASISVDYISHSMKRGNRLRGSGTALKEWHRTAR